MNKGIDADTVLSPYAKAIAAAGFSDVGRYLKNLTIAEITALHAEGIGIWLIFEHNAQDVLGGAQLGTQCGQQALTQARALGVPEGQIAIYPAADTDILPSQLAVAEDYWAAFDAVIFGHYRIAGYADGTALSGLRDHGLPLCWLAGAMGWDGSHAFLETGNPDLVQGPQLNQGGAWGLPGQPAEEWPDLGFPYDPNIIISDDIGAWRA